MHLKHGTQITIPIVWLLGSCPIATAQAQDPADRSHSLPTYRSWYEEKHVDTRMGGAADPTGAGGDSLYHISCAGADWVCVEFAEHKLASDSWVSVRSTADGASQRIDRATMAHWSSRSALLNGGSVELRFHCGTQDPTSYVLINRVVAGSHTRPPTGAYFATVCGDDGKYASVDNRICRMWIVSTTEAVSCTGFRMTNGSFVSAGHCFVSSAAVDNLIATVEFNVPTSEMTGNPAHPAPADQFPVINSSVVMQNVGIGQDWSVFGVAPNEFGEMPHDVYGLPLRAAREKPTAGATVRVTGFGTDDDGPENLTCQTAIGTYKDEYIGGPDDIDHEFFAPITPGNSGSPLIWEAFGLAIGNVTNTYCGPFVQDSATGTSFEVDSLGDALMQFSGPSVRFVDAGHPLPTTQDGTVFRPFKTVPQAIAAIPAGGIVSIVAGSYTSASGNTFTTSKPMTLTAPCGTVTIGN